MALLDPLFRLCLTALIAASLTCSACLAAPAGKISFNQSIRPILSDRCFACHGPDKNRQEAGLRLDERDEAIADRGGYSAITPGKPDESEILARILSGDPDMQMPPPAAKKPALTAEEVDLLRRWIEQGAEYEGHWAFEPMKRPTPPTVSPANEARVQNEIDRFILAGIEEQSLGSLAPEAPRHRWLRRVTLDLTGLPPTPAELQKFLADTSPDAYERVVDRLLASPRYGERMAAEWLDVARFADTHGYQVDRYRPMWLYRDWVIKAFNENLPYDDFTVWQLAGDLLPNATREQRLATAFNRLHSQNEEGGIVGEEFRVAYVVDRTTTFGTAFLGLTLECSRCHDHKFDPISQKEFYSLFAFFQNVDESGQISNFTGAMPVPTLLLSTDEQDAELARLKSAIEAAEKPLAGVAEAAEAAFAAWLAERTVQPQSDAPQISGCVGHFPFDSLENNQTANLAKSDQPAGVVEAPQIIEGKLAGALSLDGENGVTVRGVAEFTRSDPFTFSLWLRSQELVPRATILHKTRAADDAGSRGYDILQEDGRITFRMVHTWPGNSLCVRSKEALPLDEWVHLTITYDGSSRARGAKIYINGTAVEQEVVRDALWKDVLYGGEQPPLTLGHRFRDNGYRSGAVDDLRVFNRALTPLEVAELAGSPTLRNLLQVAAAELSAEDRAQLKDYFLANFHEPWKAALASLAEARRAQRTFIEPIGEIMVMREMAQPKPAFVLNRGNYDQPGEAVTATTPAVLPPLAEDAPRNRLGLAQWLVSPEHPLMARVTVNRYWQMMFGRGLVETADNFGSQGAMPTHPELLDWLARRFIASGWDTKALLKKIALSATYRQDSIAAADVLERDGNNRFLTRYPVRRLTAEMLRDQALATSGLLVEKLGGPSVKPYQPAGLWEIAMADKNYPQDHGENLYRRSLYTYWRRTIPPPSMIIFDAPDRSYCLVQRQATSTPLQALALLNDPQMVEAARFVGQRMLKEGGDTPAAQAAWAFQLLTARPPTPREQQILEQLYREQQEIFAADRSAAEELLTVGEAKADATLDQAQLAAASVLALAILNHDDAIHAR